MARAFFRGRRAGAALPACSALSEQLPASPLEKPTKATSNLLASSPAKCRICWSSDDEEGELLEGICQCAGSCKYIHSGCLARWKELQRAEKGEAAAAHCDVCKAEYHTPQHLSDTIITPTRIIRDHPSQLAVAASQALPFLKENFQILVGAYLTVYVAISAVKHLMLAFQLLTRLRSDFVGVLSELALPFFGCIIYQSITIMEDTMGPQQIANYASLALLLVVGHLIGEATVPMQLKANALSPPLKMIANLYIWIFQKIGLLGMAVPVVTTCVQGGAGLGVIRGVLSGVLVGFRVFKLLVMGLKYMNDLWQGE